MELMLVQSPVRGRELAVPAQGQRTGAGAAALAR